MKPSIFVFTTAYHPLIGGAEIAIAETVKRLSGRFSFLIFTARLSPDLPAYEKKEHEIIIRIGFGSAFDKFLLPLLLPFYVIRWRKSYPPALFWCVMISYSFLPAALLASWLQKRLVITLQEGNREWEFQWRNLGFSWLFWRLAARRVDYVTAISSFLADLFRELGYRGERMVIPNGVDVEKFQNTNSKSQTKHEAQNTKSKTIITTSRLVRKNGVDTLIRAIAEVKKTFPDIECRVVGDGPERKNFERQAASYKLQANVKFLGEVPHENIPDKLHRASVFVRASRSEGMGSSFVEALAAGLPIIGTPVGGIADIIKDGKTGLFAKVDDAHDLAVKIILLLRNHELADNLARQGMSMVKERFTWERIAETYGAVFQDASSRLSVLIATGIYPPDVGGAASVAALLQRGLTALGMNVFVLAYGEAGNPDAARTTRALPTGLRHFLAFLRALSLVYRSDAVLALDHFSMGFPTAAAARLFGRPYAVRVGGDFLWESYVESRREAIALPDFYLRSDSWSLKERVIFYLARWTLQGARTVIFTTAWQESIFAKKYGLQQTRIIENPCSPKQSVVQAGRRTDIVYAGRFIYLKNLTRLIAAFEALVKQAPRSNMKLFLIGEGPEQNRLEKEIKTLELRGQVFLEEPLPHDALIKRVARARVAVISSFSDVSPNLALEALSLGVPVILTKHCGYEFGEAEGVLRIDPFDEASLMEALRCISEDNLYDKLAKAAAKYQCRSSKETMIERYEIILKKNFYESR